MYRLIIADDEESIRNGIARSIPWQSWGYEICALCANGQEVMERLESCQPDIVLSDIRMPDMDGIELMQLLNQKYPHIKIVILSGYSDFEYLNMSIKNHVTEYLLKPTDIDEFEGVFRRLKEKMDEERLRDAEVNESIRRHFEEWLNELLHGTASEKDTERFMPLLLEKRIDMDNLIAAVFMANGCGEDKTVVSERWNQILRTASSLPEQGIHRFLFVLGGDAMVGLYSSEQEIDAASVRRDVEQIQTCVQQSVNKQIAAGISGLCTEPGMLVQAFEQANCCVRQSLFYGQTSIVEFGSMKAEKQAEYTFFDTDLLEKAVLAQSYEQIREEVDRVFDSFRTPMREYQSIDRLCISVLFHISLWGLRYGMLMEEAMRSLGTTYTDIYRCHTLQNKRMFVLIVLFACQQQLSRKRMQSHPAGSIAMRVREYIDAEYFNNAISLETVADHVQKTPAYVSRVFKNELGCNFSDYLTQCRMRRAAEYLRDPDSKVYMVAEQCGYADTSNFIRVFKRFYGVSPAEYKNLQG